MEILTSDDFRPKLYYRIPLENLQPIGALSQPNLRAATVQGQLREYPKGTSNQVILTFLDSEHICSDSKHYVLCSAVHRCGLIDTSKLTLHTDAYGWPQLPQPTASADGL